MHWNALTLLIVALGNGGVFCCKPFEISQGKRLLDLKANLGRVLSQCKNEVHNILGLLQRGDLKYGMEAFCKVHSSCMDSLVDGDTAKETYMLYSPKDFTPVQFQGVKKILDCFLNTEVIDMPPHVLDDLAALGNRYIKSTGR
ncbi:uncharacterized protein LOC119173462 isoform X2 [Rhipicephalus microplus]|uniref:uncharacterized protein LOC119173462 isoform X2 n=1 Tax=Rhipicephalus microplus TaxID=6941 RepID=UPI003F6C4596